MSKLDMKSAWAKIDRAKHHLEQLQLEMARQSQSEGTIIRNDLKARQHVITYQAPQKLLIDYAVISGEIVYQARSALEHAIRVVVPKPGRWTAFPVVLTSSEYKSEVRSKIRGIKKQAATVIERAQPFNNGGKASLLWILHDMWNRDKHRLLNVVAVDFAGVAFNYLKGERFVQRFKGLPGKLKDGAEFRMDFPDFYEPGKMRVDPEVGIRLEFEIVPGYAFETLLTRLVDFGESTVRDLSNTIP